MRSFLFAIGLLLTTTLTADEQTFSILEADIIKARVLVVEGSRWDSQEGREVIGKQVAEARRIWFANIGVKLSIRPITVVPGSEQYRADQNKLTGQLAELATTHQAAASDIVVLFVNEIYVESVAFGMTVAVKPRAYAEKELITSDTPVILISAQVLDKPGTKRDLAHEFTHVFLRDPADPGGGLRSQGVNIGDSLTAEDKKKALRYPAEVPK